jgi:hypothetical protein
MKRLSLIMAAALVAAFAVPARAATAVASAQVPYEFSVGKTKLPAGHYEILAADDVDSAVLVVRNTDTHKEALVEYLTRIGARKDADSALVFDVVGNDHLLSEIHLAGTEGYLLEGAVKRPHTHHEVKAQRASSAKK